MCDLWPCSSWNLNSPDLFCSHPRKDECFHTKRCSSSGSDPPSDCRVIRVFLLESDSDPWRFCCRHAAAFEQFSWIPLFSRLMFLSLLASQPDEVFSVRVRTGGDAGLSSSCVLSHYSMKWTAAVCVTTGNWFKDDATQCNRLMQLKVPPISVAWVLRKV